MSKLPILVLAFTVACMPAGSAASQQPAAAYDQPYRPQIHFSPARNWTNDPNGLVYFDGEYHLFYQYNPFGDQWGHMSWGHAVSRDLLHWTELPVALPEHDGEMIFTGSIVIDAKNTSGFCDAGKPCMVAVYTSHRVLGKGQREAQSLAYSRDRGRTWTFYQGNPVLDLNLPEFRDPSVFWNSQTGDWLMVVSLPNDHKVAFYRSSDLKHWTSVSTFGPAGATGGQWECPDLLQVPAAAGKGSTWVLKVGLNPGALQGGSGEQYFTGSFDGHTFTADAASHAGARWTDYGKDSYCAISFNHLPTGQLPILVGWMDNWQYASKLPTSPWRGQMTIPRRLSAARIDGGWTLIQEPIVASLRQGAPVVIHAQLSLTHHSVDLSSVHNPAEIELTFDRPPERGAYGIRFVMDASHYVEAGFDPANHTVYVDRTHAGDAPGASFPARTSAPVASGSDLRIVLDRSSVEVFAAHGSVAMTNLVFPAIPFTRAELFTADESGPSAVHGKMWPLRSIWPR